MPLVAEMLTREIFGNIPPWSKGLFYLLATAALGIFCWGCYRRVRLWRLGQSRPRSIRWSDAASRFIRNVLLQRRVLGRGLASVAHVLMFGGFCVLFVGTLLVAAEHVLASLLGREHGQPVFHYGIYFLIYEVVLDAAGLAFLAGLGMFLYRRLRLPSSSAHSWLDWGLLSALVTIGVTGYLTEGLRIIRENTPLPGVSFVGLGAAQLLRTAGVGAENVSACHFSLWWVHAIAALALIAATPYSRLLHSLAGAVNLALAPSPLGELASVSPEDVERTGRYGVGAIQEFSRIQLLQLDACVSCGRCQDACPAYEAGKPLSPRDVVQDVLAYLDRVGPGLLGSSGQPGADSAGKQQLVGEAIAVEALWSCTSCSACVDVCPLGVNPWGLIHDMRRHLIGEGRLHGAPAASLAKAQRSGNPWGLPTDQRFAWAEGLDVPTVQSRPDFEILYWVGCAAAYDRRLQKIARSVVTLLQQAGVKFAVLGPEERCTGESARRMGDEFVFRELAEANLATLNRHQVRKIVTHCPHCLNSFRQDYPQLGGRFEVVHHSQLLAELVESGRLRVRPTAKLAGSLTYHDPCYLARVSGITDQPRRVIEACDGDSPLAIVEMPRHGRATACCGAGGGRMWFDDAPSERVGIGRVREAIDTGAKTVAVSCPFCLVMVGDGMAASAPYVQVRDISELLVEALEDPPA